MDPIILFDLDRTLVDAQSHTDYHAAVRDIDAIVDDWPDFDVPETEWDAPTQRCMGILVALSGDPRWSTVSDAIERHEIAAHKQSTAMPGLAECLEQTSGFRRAVVTLLPERASRMILDLHEVDIDLIVPRAPIYRPKPAPDQLWRAVEALGGAAQDAVFIGDSSWDAAAAEAAGIRFVGVTNNDTSLFDPGTETHPDLLTSVAAVTAR